MNAQEVCYEHKAHPLPVFGDSTRMKHESKLAEAQANYNKDSSNADAIIWLGRRKAYLGQYQEAIDVFTRGILIHPSDARMYRHRGHRYITLRCFDKAIDDFEKAASLIKGKPDEIEPDGLPNAKNIPTSTLQSNTWYHLGLAYYLEGKYQEALNAYANCLKVSTNPDMYVATVNWLYITLVKLGKNKEAADLLGTIHSKMDIIENRSYLQLLLKYKEELSMEDHETFNSVADATTGYGVGNYYLVRGEQKKALAMFRKVLQSNQWSSFGFIAAEQALEQMKEK